MEKIAEKSAPGRNRKTDAVIVLVGASLIGNFKQTQKTTSYDRQQWLQSLKNNPEHAKIASPELKTILSLGLNQFPQASTTFLLFAAAKTSVKGQDNSGYESAELLKDYLKLKNYHSEIVELPDLTDQHKFNLALAGYTSKVLETINSYRDVRFIATGGFKALGFYAALIGSVFNKPVHYVFEKFDQAKSIDAWPITFDFKRFNLYHEQLKAITALRAGEGESEYKALPDDMRQLLTRTSGGAYVESPLGEMIRSAEEKSRNTSFKVRVERVLPNFWARSVKAGSSADIDAIKDRGIREFFRKVMRMPQVNKLTFGKISKTKPKQIKEGDRIIIPLQFKGKWQAVTAEVTFGFKTTIKQQLSAPPRENTAAADTAQPDMVVPANVFEEIYESKSALTTNPDALTPEGTAAALETAAQKIHEAINKVLLVKTRVTIKSANLDKIISFPAHSFIEADDKSTAKLFNGNSALLETLAAGRKNKHATFSLHFDEKANAPKWDTPAPSHYRYDFGTAKPRLLSAPEGIFTEWPKELTPSGDEPTRLLKLLEDTELDAVYSIPVSLTGIEGGGVTLLTERPLRPDEIHQVNIITDELLMDLLVADNRAAMQKQANRAAASAIFTHAFAHDIGAHALAPLAAALTNAGKTPTNTELASIFSYLQQKSTMWARLAEMEAPAIGGDTVSISRLLKEVRSQELLFKTMLASELDGETPKSIEFKFTVNNAEIADETDKVWLPYGKTAGAQLFFTIIETLLRNTKHWIMRADKAATTPAEVQANKAKIIKEGLKVTAEFSPVTSEAFWEVAVSTNLPLGKDAGKIAKGVNEHLKALRLIENGSPARKGSTEMLIAAGLLRGIGIDAIQQAQGLITAHAANNALAYKLKMFRGEEFKILQHPANTGHQANNEDSPHRIRFLLTGTAEAKPAEKIRCWHDSSLDINSALEEVHMSWLKHWLGITGVSLTASGQKSELHIARSGAKEETYTLEHRHPEPFLATVGYNSTGRLAQEINARSRQLRLAETLATQISVIDQRALACIHPDNASPLAGMNLTAASPETLSELRKLYKYPARLSVLHTSLLESLCKQQGVTPGSEAKNLFRLSQDSRSLIAFTSGKSAPQWLRAVTAEFPHRSRFIPWSDLEATIRRLSKPYDRSNVNTEYLLAAKEDLLEVMLNK